MAHCLRNKFKGLASLVAHAGAFLLLGASAVFGFNRAVMEGLPATNNAINVSTGSSAATSQVTVQNLAVDQLPANQCVQTTLSGGHILLATSGGQCGSGGGGGGGGGGTAAPISWQNGGVIVSSPFTNVNNSSMDFTDTLVGATVQHAINPNSTTFDARFLKLSTTFLQGTTIYVSSETVKNAFSLTYLSSGAIPFNGPGGLLMSTTNMIWDNTGGGGIVLGGGGASGGAGLTLNNSNGATSGIVVQGMGNNATAYTASGSGNIRNTVTSTGGGTQFIWEAEGNLGPSTRCAGTSSGDDCIVARLTGVPPFTRGARLFISADLQPDGNNGSIGEPPRIIVAPAGVVFDAGPTSFTGQVAASTPMAPVQIGYGANAPVPNATKVMITYPSDAFMVIADSGTGEPQLYFGVQSTYTVIGSTSASDLHIRTNGADIMVLNTAGITTAKFSDGSTLGGTNILQGQLIEQSSMSVNGPLGLSVLFGVTVGSLNFTGPGNGTIIFTINSSTFGVVSSSNTNAVPGAPAIWTTTLDTLGSGVGFANIFTTETFSASQNFTAPITVVGSSITTNGLTSTGHLNCRGGTPSLSSCGSSPSISGTSSDCAGKITEGTGSPSGCVVTFSGTYATNPFCIVETTSTVTQAAVSAQSGSQFTITTSVSIPSDTLLYTCIGGD